MTSIPQPNDDRTWKYAGRDFCRFGIQQDISCVPVDDQEKERFSEQNLILEPILGGPVAAPGFPPRGVETPKVLDCGFGTGAWISDLLDVDYFPQCEVVGVDIFDCDTRRISDEDEDDNSDEGRDVSPVQEFVKIKWNLNAPFRLARHPDLMRGLFHLINSRFLIDGINADRWESLIGEYMELLAPGGWLQMIEFEWVFQSAKGQHLPNLERWWNLYSTALRSMRNRKDPVIARRLYHLMARAGFERLTDERKDIPIGAWTNDEGPISQDWTKTVVSEMLESFALVPFTRVLGKTQSECESIVRAAQEELETEEARIYNTLRVICGRKPRNRKP